MESQFIKQIKALETGLQVEQRTHANRIRVLEALAEANRDYATDAEIAQAMLGTGLTEAQLKRRLQAFESVIHEMIISVYMHIRIEASEPGQGASE